jgi:hypothetical protein
MPWNRTSTVVDPTRILRPSKVFLPTKPFAHRNRNPVHTFLNDESIMPNTYHRGDPLVSVLPIIPPEIPPRQSDEENHMRPGALHFTPHLDGLLAIGLYQISENVWGSAIGRWKVIALHH